MTHVTYSHEWLITYSYEWLITYSYEWLMNDSCYVQAIHVMLQCVSWHIDSICHRWMRHVETSSNSQGKGREGGREREREIERTREREREYFTSKHRECVADEYCTSTHRVIEFLDASLHECDVWMCAMKHRNDVSQMNASHRVIHQMFWPSSDERWGAGVETQENVRREIGGWGRVPFNEPYAPLLSTIYDGA